MKAYFLPVGVGADRSLPAMLTAVSCGASREVKSVSMLRISAAAPGPLAGSMITDLNACRDYFAGKDAFAFFRTEWSVSDWHPVLPDRGSLVQEESSRLLLSALRGENQPLSYRTDPEAVECAHSAIFESIPEDWREHIGPFFSREDALSLQKSLDRIYASGETVYPEKSRIFRYPGFSFKQK